MTPRDLLKGAKWLEINCIKIIICHLLQYLHKGCKLLPAAQYVRLDLFTYTGFYK